MLTIGSVVLVAVLYWSLESPRAYYTRARKLLSQHPSRCEQLAEQAVMKAGGNYPEAQLLQCRALAAMGEWDAALGGFSLIKNTTRCPSEALLDLGAKALEANELKLADMALRVARVPGSSYALATQLQVRLNLQLQLREEALALCREWQAALPDAALPWATAAEIETSQFELGSAIADYYEALRRVPSSELKLAIRSSLAKLLVHTGDVAAARTQFDKLLESGPVARNVRMDYVQLLRMEGRFDEALAELERHRSDVGLLPDILKQRGFIQFDLGRLDEALADLKAAADGNPFDIGTHHLLAQVYRRRGQSTLAKPHLEQSHRLTEATLRVNELKDLLRTDPSNPSSSQWRLELKDLTKVIGH